MQLSENVTVTKRWQACYVAEESIAWGHECEQGAPHGSLGNFSFSRVRTLSGQ